MVNREINLWITTSIFFFLWRGRKYKTSGLITHTEVLFHTLFFIWCVCVCWAVCNTVPQGSNMMGISEEFSLKIKKHV